MELETGTVITPEELLTLGLVDAESGEPIPMEGGEIIKTVEGEASETPEPESSSPDVSGQPVVQAMQQASQWVAHQSQQVRLMAEAEITRLLREDRELSEADARAQVQPQLNEALAFVQMQAQQMALQPIASQAVATDIARRLSIPGKAEVKAEELMTEQTPQAMEAKARALVEQRRGSNFQARKAAGTDRVEGGPSGGLTINYDDMDPKRVIALGIARGELG